MNLIGFVMIVIGTCMGVHSAMGVTQFKHYSGIHGIDGSILPMDIYIECLGALLIILMALVHVYGGQFKPIVKAPQMTWKVMDQLFYCEDFVTFNHRKHPLASTFVTK